MISLSSLMEKRKMEIYVNCINSSNIFKNTNGIKA